MSLFSHASWSLKQYTEHTKLTRMLKKGILLSLKMVGLLEAFNMGKPNTNFHQVACSPSHRAPSACTSPPYVQSPPAAASGTSGRLADTPSGPRLPRDLPLRYRSKGQVEAGWRDQSQRPHTHLRCRRGSDSLSPGC